MKLKQRQITPMTPKLSFITPITPVVSRNYSHDTHFLNMINEAIFEAVALTFRELRRQAPIEPVALTFRELAQQAYSIEPVALTFELARQASI